MFDESEDGGDIPYQMEIIKEGEESQIQPVPNMNVGTVVAIPDQKIYISVFIRTVSTATVEVKD